MGRQFPSYPTIEVDRELVNAALHDLFAGVCAFGPVTEAMRYAAVGGKRIRPVLSLRISRLSGTPSVITMRAALAVELFHSASLVIDDLPCMDNDDQRRGQPSVHRKYGEATAILAAFGLVSLGAKSLADVSVAHPIRQEIADFQRRLLEVLGCSGLVGGQALDLGLGGPTTDLRRTAEFKTAPLFELAARAGTLGANIPAEKAAELHEFGRRLGIVFQIMDDILDGASEEFQTTAEMLSGMIALLKPYGRAADPLHEIIDYLSGEMQRKAGLCVGQQFEP
jgi:farnesyl diphosphate synthase